MYSSTCLVAAPLGTSNSVPTSQVSPHQRDSQGDRKFRQHFLEHIYNLYLHPHRHHIYIHITYINIIFTSTLLTSTSYLHPHYLHQHHIYTHITYINIIFTSTLPICINIQVTHITLKLPNYVPICIHVTHTLYHININITHIIFKLPTPYPVFIFISTLPHITFTSLSREEIPDGLLLSHCCLLNAVVFYHVLHFHDSFQHGWVTSPNGKRHKFIHTHKGLPGRQHRSWFGWLLSLLITAGVVCCIYSGI